MPRRNIFDEQCIVEAAIKLVRKQGLEALSTRNLAKALSSSTMPIYTYFKSSKKIEERIVKEAYEVLMEYQTTPRTGDIFLDMGVGYVLFALKEKNLFRCINHEQHIGMHRKYNDRHLDMLIEKLSDYPYIKGLNEDQVRKFFFQGWIYSHGLAQLVNSGFYKDIGEAEIIDLLTYTGTRYVSGFMHLRDNDDK